MSFSREKGSETSSGSQKKGSKVLESFHIDGVFEDEARGWDLAHHLRHFATETCTRRLSWTLPTQASPTHQPPLAPPRPRHPVQVPQALEHPTLCGALGGERAAARSSGRPRRLAKNEKNAFTRVLNGCCGPVLSGFWPMQHAQCHLKYSPREPASSNSPEARA